MTTQPNAIQIMNYLAPYPGNFMRSVLALESELEKTGSSCLLLFPNGAQRLDWIRQLQADGKRIFFLPGRIVQDARFLASLIGRYRVSILHSHFASTKMHVAALLARAACPAVVSIVHVHNHERPRGRLQTWLKRSIVNADLHLAVSNHVREDLIAKGYGERNCIAVTNAVDFSRLDSFALPPADPGPGKTKVLMFGFDFERKGVDIAVEALSRYDGGRRMMLMIVVATNMEAVKARIESMLGRVPEWICLLPPRDDIASYYRRAEVFLSPSREEGLPYALVEAAYCGLRLVASDIGGQTGLGIPHLLHFKSEDRLGLYRALEAVTEGQAQQQARCIEEARSYVTGRFRLENWVRDIVRIYAGLPGGKSAWRRAGVASSPR